MEQGRLEEARRWLGRSRETLAAARYLAFGVFRREALSRVYYSMFYAARALLASRGIDLHRHSAVIAAVGREFVRGGILDQSFHQALIASFESRGRADYLVFDDGDDEEDLPLNLRVADDFVSAVELFLNITGTE